MKNEIANIIFVFSFKNFIELDNVLSDMPKITSVLIMMINEWITSANIYILESELVEFDDRLHRATEVGDKPLKALLLGGGDFPIILTLKPGFKNGFVDLLIISDLILLLDPVKRANLLRLRHSKSAEPILTQSLSLELDSYAFGL